MRTEGAPAPYVEGPRGLRAVPCVHYRVSYTRAVEYVLAGDDGWRPDVVAVELAPSFRMAVEEGLRAPLASALWAARGLRERLATLPKEKLSNWRNTAADKAALYRLLLAARGLALRSLSGSGRALEANWLTDVHAGFEPVVFLFEPLDARPHEARRNFMPDRRHIYSLGAYERALEEGRDRLWRPTLGRIWFHPPLFDPETGSHGQWTIPHENHPVPDSLDPSTKGLPASGWAEALLRAGLQRCQDHVIVACDTDLHGEALEGATSFAQREGKELVVVELADLDPSDVARLRANEYELWVCDWWDDPAEEIISLHSGDAIVEAVRLALEQELRIEFIDIEVDRPMDLALMDKRALPAIEDALLTEEGLESHFERLRATVEATRIEEIDGPRELHMAARLRDLLAQGDQVLFVCGMAHWGPISKALQDDRTPAPGPDQDQARSPARLVCAAPYAMGSLTQECPSTVVHYMECRRRGALEDFTHVGAHEWLMSRIQGALPETSISARAYLSFEKYLHRLTTLGALGVPRLPQLWCAARSCLDRDGETLIMAEATRIRAKGCPDGVPRLQDLRMVGGNAVSGALQDQIRLMSRWGGIDYVFNSETGKLQFSRRDGANGASGGTLVSHPRWEALHQRAYVDARARSGLRTPEAVAREVTGLIRGTVDVRATARARAAGSEAVFCSEQSHRRQSGQNPFEDFEPVIWSFNPDSGGEFKNFWVDTRHDLKAALLLIGSKNKSELGSRVYELNGLVTVVPSVAHADRHRVRRWSFRRRAALTGRSRPADWREYEKRLVAEGVDRNLARLFGFALPYGLRGVILVSEDRPPEPAEALYAVHRLRVFYVPLSQVGAGVNLRHACLEQYRVSASA